MGLFDFLKTDPAERLRKAIRDKSTEAMHLQRNGKIPELARVTAEMSRMERELEALEQPPKA